MYVYLDDAKNELEKMNLGKRISEGSFSAIYNHSKNKYLLITIEKNKINYLKKIYSEIETINFSNNIYGIIVPKLEKINIGKTEANELYKLNKFLNKNHVSIDETIYKAEIFLNENNLKMKDSILSSLHIIKEEKIKVFKFDFKASQFLSINKKTICIDPIIFE